LYSTGPFSQNILRCHVKGLEQGLVIRENTFAFGHFPQLAVVAFDHIGGVDDLADFRRVLEKGG
jgi:hypothetical protein